MTRIEELRRALAASGYLSKEDGQRLFHHIDHLTAQVTAKDAEIERLREVVEEFVRESKPLIYSEPDSTEWGEAMDWLGESHTSGFFDTALAATSRGEVV